MFFYVYKNTSKVQNDISLHTTELKIHQNMKKRVKTKSGHIVTIPESDTMHNHYNKKNNKQEKLLWIIYHLPIIYDTPTYQKSKSK